MESSPQYRPVRGYTDIFYSLVYDVLASVEALGVVVQNVLNAFLRKKRDFKVLFITSP